jgi:hypothetical protein
MEEAVIMWNDAGKVFVKFLDLPQMGIFLIDFKMRLLTIRFGRLLLSAKEAKPSDCLIAVNFHGEMFCLHDIKFEAYTKHLKV